MRFLRGVDDATVIQLNAVQHLPFEQIRHPSLCDTSQFGAPGLNRFSDPGRYLELSQFVGDILARRP